MRLDGLAQVCQSLGNTWMLMVYTTQQAHPDKRPSLLTLSSFGPKDKAEFERLLVEYQADSQLPDLFITRPSTRRLFAFLNKH
ncbi:hypothetical protein F443_21160 [Phytophthora nicotianae P1569]|uniref:Uncharacterized protein n=1 Tax=Phytophthora nicotianae P1569 TaxID=1317065 RepID=V9E073_PHYNI|nr:hypothetical protein F443_21160 [Phytophthora nicotianae P1569]